MKVIISCVGEDGKLHACEPEKEESICGTRVERKKLQNQDWKLISCVECTC